MAISKEVKYERGGSRDSQFQIWRLSTISESKKLTRVGGGIRHKEPIRITDADLLLDEISFPASSMPRKSRGLHLSLKQTKILATLLPDAIIDISDLNNDDRIDTFVGVLLFADVSGFTALCEKYNGFGKSGSDKLTATLNDYLGAMVEVIYKCGGDVLKFSGDAILALWKLGNNEYMYSLIHKVISCALYIQNSMGIYETEVKVLLKVKLAISAGNMMFSVIGDDNSRHYVVVGSPVHEVKAAEQACTSGEVVLAYSAWGHLSPVNYEYYWKDNEHVKIVRIIYNPENSKREILHTEEKGNVHRSEAHHRFLGRKEILNKGIKNSNSFSEVRTHVTDATRRNLCSELRTFLIPSVIQQIDADLPMEYLSEMRNVTVMFVNIVPHRLHTKKLISMVDKVYVTICSLAYKAMGSVNKVSLFDKDVMILVIFGLRGFNHEGEVAACLKCAYDIRQACCSLDEVFTVSAGVTTGQAYCGVVGHPLRREYTVIGAVVNKAARIMCAYPGKVTCDRDTYLVSNLAATFFTIQEKRYLKGIEDTGPIYEFSQEKSKNTLAAMNEGIYPIIGRDEEIKTFQNILHSLSNRPSWEKAIVIKGQARIGKTRLMDEMVLEAHKKGFTPFTIALHNVHSALPYGAAQYIVKQILEIPDSATVTYREQRLTSLLRKHVPLSECWYLNEFMNVKFPRTFDEGEIDQSQKFEKIEKLFNIILARGTKSVIFAIDDIEFCDELSWRLIVNVIDKRIKFLIMTMPKRLRPEITNFLKFPPETESHVVKLMISGLPNDFIATLACQILNARAVPVEVVRALIVRSNGSPGWCESFLLSLCQSNVLKVEELPEWHVKNLGLIMPPEPLLSRKQYKTIFDRPKEDEEEKPLKSVRVRDKEVEEEKSGFQRKKKIANRIKFSRFIIKKDDEKGYATSEINYNAPGSTVVQIEDAYEDLRQRIELARSQSKFLGTRTQNFLTSEIPAVEVKKHEKLREEFMADRHAANKSDAEYTESIKDKMVEDLVKYVDSSFNDDDLLSDSESDISLKEKIQEINSRFSRKGHVSKMVGSDRGAQQFRNIRIMRSLEDLSEERDLSNRSKSAEQLLNRHSKPVFEGDAAKNEGRLSMDVTSEFSPNDLWKSYTQDLIEESVKIFLEKKGKFRAEDLLGLSLRENVYGMYSPHDAASEHSDVQLSRVASTADLPVLRAVQEPTEIPERDVETDEKIIGSQKEDINEMECFMKTNDTRNVCDSSEESELTEDGYRPTDDGGRCRDSLDMSSKKITKRSNIFRKTDEPNSQRSDFKNGRSWLVKIFDWMKKHSDSGSSASGSDLELPAQLLESNAILPAILINPEVNLDEVPTPECFVGVIMSAFDCLSPYEQLMLKCGSIIGEKFTRKMLNAIMHDPNPLLTSEAVKRLFEMRILCCGSDVDDLENELMNDLRCMCPLTNNDIVDDALPRYSFCRLLLFKYALFRSTLYELIPLDQKREFHIRAVEFLEREQNYCSSCEILFKKDQQFSSRMNSFADYGLPFEDPKFRRRTGLLPIHLLNMNVDSDMHVKKKDVKLKTELSVFTVPNLLPSFQNCECLLLQADALRQLMNHSVAAGLKEKEIDFIIKYSSIMITLGEFEEADGILADVETEMKVTVGNSIANRKERKIFLGRIHLLQGQLNIERGMLKKANIYLLSALKCFGSGFVPLRPLRSLQFVYEYLKQILYQKHPKTFCNKGQHPTDGSAVCLSLLSNVYMLQNRWELAKLVAIRSLNILQRRNSNIIELCNAYSNAIDIYRHFGDFKFCRKLEAAAAQSNIKTCTYKRGLELIAIGRLNCSLLNARLISGYLVAASKLGESAVKISQSISSHSVETYTITEVSQTMMMIGKLNRAAGLILLLPVQDIWYYVLSLEFILETGFVIEESNTCLQAITSIINSGRDLDADVMRRAVSVVHLWLVRLGKFQEADTWSEKLPRISQIPLSGDAVNNMICVLKILEGDLLKLASYEEQELRHNPLNDKIKSVIKALEKSIKSAEIMCPRYLHLCAYYQYRIHNLSGALAILARAKKISINQGNVLERSWISHSKKVWTNTCDFDIDYWLNAATMGGLMRWTEGRDLLSWKNYMYSLTYFKS